MELGNMFAVVEVFCVLSVHKCVHFYAPLTVILLFIFAKYLHLVC